MEARDVGLGAAPTDAADLQLTAAFFREAGFPGPLLSAGGHDYASGAAYLDSGRADAVVYGRHFIPNPDLVARFAAAKDGKVELLPYDRSTFYASGSAGYLP